MKFGNKWDPNAEEATTGSSDYLRYFKNSETTFRVLQEPEDWIDYWEHYNPNGYPFPCTRERDTCKGCVSSNEKMKKASKKIAIQVLEGEWVNAYKIPKTVADKLANRANRAGTMTDRDYTIFKIQTKNSDGSIKTDYDVEGGDKSPVDVAALEPKFKDVETILASMYEQAWGTPDAAMQTENGAKDAQDQADLEKKVEEPNWSKRPDNDDKVWTEEELRKLELEELLDVCATEGMNVPQELRDQKQTDPIVDWLLDQ